MLPRLSIHFSDLAVIILGISAFYHDSAAALVRDGEIVAAVQEECFTRKKLDASFPKNSVDFCLKEAGIALGNVDLVVFYDKPFLKFERLLETYLAFAPKGFNSFRMAIPVGVAERKIIPQGSASERTESAQPRHRLGPPLVVQ